MTRISSSSRSLLAGTMRPGMAARFLFSLKSEPLCSTIFSSSSMSSLDRSADMNALTVVETTSGFLVPGSAVCPTELMTGRRCSDLALNLGQHLGPRGGPLDEVARVLLVQPVAVGDVDELVVAHAALVGEERELRRSCGSRFSQHSPTMLVLRHSSGRFFMSM